MVKNRDRIDIFAAIVEAVNVGASKTRIMFRANLSFKLTEKYINQAKNAGLIYASDSGRCGGQMYYLTEEGKGFLKKYRRFATQNATAQLIVYKLSIERQKLSQSI